MASIHVTDNGAAYVSSHHTDEEIRELLGKADHVYVDYHQLGDKAVEEAERIRKAYADVGHHGAVVIGMEGDPWRFNGEAVAIGRHGFTAVTEHFDTFAARAGRQEQDHAMRAIRSRRAAERSR